ncbi:hypothetical protein SLEP1_g23310 [Rubroshorea leprosula]|uniref:Stress enhanced protein 2 n=1 Tax=Rubroshorea leprosula TaxID=152421 RepID=A0AAV5JL68_9ROSI|nr:hypothetical protein SLEP1_g23310 [Rubroshorea leprosula]
MAAVAGAIRCELPSAKPAVLRKETASGPAPVQRVKLGEAENGKIVLQPRLCTLRSYGSDRGGVMRTRRDGGADEGSPFFETLSEYIESSKKSHDFEIISGRLAMVVFAATVTTEIVTGDSVFRKMDVQGIEETIGVYVGAMISAAIFAWLSSARDRVGKIFTVSCNAVIDSLIDQIVDGLFYESELSDWSDDI